MFRHIVAAMIDPVWAVVTFVGGVVAGYLYANWDDLSYIIKGSKP